MFRATIPLGEQDYTPREVVAPGWSWGACLRQPCHHSPPNQSNLQRARMRRLINLCRDLHSKGMIYTVKYYLKGKNPRAEILAEREDRL